MITQNQRDIVYKAWRKGPLPSDAQIEAAYEKWKAEAAADQNNSDFYFDFGLTLTTYSSWTWEHLFK